MTHSGVMIELLEKYYLGLNPSFAGWPTLGKIDLSVTPTWKRVLIPLLLDDPLWVMFDEPIKIDLSVVLIPLLLDDPLWGRDCQQLADEVSS